MFANERMAYICDLLKKNGAVTTANLSSTLGVSIETIRKDLLMLEKEDRLFRVHGGAISNVNSVKRLSLKDRLVLNREEKQILSKAACDFISEGDILAIDTGSTSVEFAEILRLRFNELTVITHSIDVFELLKEKSGFKIILVGGLFMPEENAFYGMPTLETYKTLHANKAFITPAGISLKNGISCCNEPLMVVVRQMIESADKVFVLANSDKFEKTALFRLTSMSDEFTYITDSKISDNLKSLYKENDINIVTK